MSAFQETLVLQKRQIELVVRFGSPFPYFHVPDDPNHSEPHRIPTRVVERDPLSHSIAVRPKGFRQLFIYDHDSRRILCVTFGKLAPLEQRDVHCLEVSGTRHAEDAVRPFAWARRWPSLDA